jgi:hypothetical protein
VELEHRNIDRHGPGWEAVTDGIDVAQGWLLYLERYAALLKEACEALAPTAPFIRSH